MVLGVSKVDNLFITLELTYVVETSKETASSSTKKTSKRHSA